ncbi:zinc finger, CCHC-type containing protein [Tanacetum coccineum]
MTTGVSANIMTPKADPSKELKHKGFSGWFFQLTERMMMLHGGLTQEQLYMCVKIDGSILHMGNESTALVHGRGCVDLRLTIITDNIGPSQGFWGEAILTACYLLNRVPSKRNRMTPYELWTKRKPNLRVWGCRAVVRLPDPKLKTLGERGIECIFVGYAEHSKAFSPETKSESLKDRTEYIRSSVVPEKVIEEVVQQPEPELRKSKRNRTLKSFGPEFQLYLIEGTRDLISDQHSYCFNVEDDPKIFDEAMKSQDVSFWKESINNEMDSIMGNNTWVLADLPPGCRPLGCKWIFKRKLKVDGTVEKFKARLVIQGFKQKSRIDYFDTYALVELIRTIRLVIAMASIHILIIHQMDVKTAFLNGELEEEFYMNQPQGFIMPGNENKVDLTKEFLSSRFSMKDMGG